MRFSSLVVSALLAGVFAAPTTNSASDKRYVVHEKRDKLPLHWNRSAKLHPASTIPIRIALTQSNLDKAEEYLLDVSHPKSPNFGKHWTAKQIAETFAPAKDTVDAVSAWLSESGITGFSQSQSLTWINAKVTVEQAERLLQTSFYEYVHENGKSHIACEVYSVPEDLRRHIDFITPTVHFDVKVNQPKKRDTAAGKDGSDKPSVVPGKAKNIGSASSNIAAPKTDGEIPYAKIITELKQCDKYITPDCLRALYLFPPDFPANPGSK
jgi:tripeptidyl-peptidase-1